MARSEARAKDVLLYLLKVSCRIRESARVNEVRVLLRFTKGPKLELNGGQ